MERECSTGKRDLQPSGTALSMSSLAPISDRNSSSQEGRGEIRQRPIPALGFSFPHRAKLGAAGRAVWGRLFYGSALCVLISCSAAFGQTAIPQDHHAWGKFRIGAWKRVRVVTESLNPQGAVESRSITDTTTTLIDLNADTYTLYVDAAVEIAGKRFETQPQVITQSFDGAPEGQKTDSRKVGEENLMISGRKIPSEIREITFAAGGTRRVTTVHYSPDVAPWVLRRDTKVLPAEEGAPTQQTTVEVIAFDMPHKVVDQTIPTAHVRTVHVHPRGASVTVEVISSSVPGGVVAHTSKEQDSSGNVLRRSTLELVDYGLETNEKSEPKRFRFFQRFRRNRNG